MRPKTARRKCLPLSSFRVWCGLRGDVQGLPLCPTAWEGHVIGQIQLQGRTCQADPIHTWILRDELHQSSVWHPLPDDLQMICRDADERDDVRVL